MPAENHRERNKRPLEESEDGGGGSSSRRRLDIIHDAYAVPDTPGASQRDQGDLDLSGADRYTQSALNTWMRRAIPVHEGRPTTDRLRADPAFSLGASDESDQPTGEMRDANRLSGSMDDAHPSSVSALDVPQMIANPNELSPFWLEPDATTDRGNAASLPGEDPFWSSGWQEDDSLTPFLSADAPLASDLPDYQAFTDALDVADGVPGVQDPSLVSGLAMASLDQREALNAFSDSSLLPSGRRDLKEALRVFSKDASLKAKYLHIQDMDYDAIYDHYLAYKKIKNKKDASDAEGQAKAYIYALERKEKKGKLEAAGHTMGNRDAKEALRVFSKDASLKAKYPLIRNMDYDTIYDHYLNYDKTNDKKYASDVEKQAKAYIYVLRERETKEKLEATGHTVGRRNLKEALRLFSQDISLKSKYKHIQNMDYDTIYDHCLNYDKTKDKKDVSDVEKQAKAYIQVLKTKEKKEREKRAEPTSSGLFPVDEDFSVTPFPTL